MAVVVLRYTPTVNSEYTDSHDRVKVTCIQPKKHGKDLGLGIITLPKCVSPRAEEKHLLQVARRWPCSNAIDVPPSKEISLNMLTKNLPSISSNFKTSKQKDEMNPLNGNCAQRTPNFDTWNFRSSTNSKNRNLTGPLRLRCHSTHVTLRHTLVSMYSAYPVIYLRSRGGVCCALAINLFEVINEDMKGRAECYENGQVMHGIESGNDVMYWRVIGNFLFAVVG